MAPCLERLVDSSDREVEGDPGQGAEARLEVVDVVESQAELYVGMKTEMDAGDEVRL